MAAAANLIWAHKISNIVMFHSTTVRALWLTLIAWFVMEVINTWMTETATRGGTTHLRDKYESDGRPNVKAGQISLDYPEAEETMVASTSTKSAENVMGEREKVSATAAESVTIREGLVGAANAASITAISGSLFPTTASSSVSLESGSLAATGTSGRVVDFAESSKIFPGLTAADFDGLPVTMLDVIKT